MKQNVQEVDKLVMVNPAGSSDKLLQTTHWKGCISEFWHHSRWETAPPT